MNTLWLKTFRDLWLYKGRTLLVVLAIAIGTAAAGVCVTSLIVLGRDLRDGYARSNPAHAVLDTTPFDEALASEVAALPEVDETQARRLTAARLVEGGGATRPLLLWTIPDFEKLSVGMLFIQPNALVPPPPGTVLLERSVQLVLGVRQGDRITVRMADGDEAELTVAGFVNDMSQAATGLQPAVYGYLTDETAGRLGLPEPYNQLWLRVAEPDPDRAGVERTVSRVTDWLDAEGVSVIRAGIPEPGVHIMQSNVDTGMLMIGILGGLTLLLSAFLVTNVMSAIIARQVPQIGVLKALGGKRRLVLGLYSRMVLIFGLLALALAVPLGLMGAYFQSSFLAGQLNFDIPSFGLPWQTLVVQVIGALLIPALAALWPVRQAAATTIREALGGQGIASLSTGSRRVEGRPLRALPLRNLARRKVRLVLTLAALSLAGAMFIATFGLRAGMYEAVEILIGEFPYDVQLDFADPQPVQRLLRTADDVETELLETEFLPRNSVSSDPMRAEAWGVADVRRVYPDGRTGSSFTLYGVPPTTEIAAFANREGRWLYGGPPTADGGPPHDDCAPAAAGRRPSAICLYINYEAEKLTGRPAVGEALALKVNGERERETGLVGISLRPFDPNAYMLYADFEEATGLRGRASRLVVYLEGDDPAVQAAVADTLVDRFEAAGVTVVRSETSATYRDSYRAQFNNLVLLLMVLAGLTALVSGLGLANTMALNVLERSREIGILRSMGARRPLLRRLILGEGLAIALVSAAVGVVLALPLTALLDRIMGNSLLGSPLAFVFSPLAALAWLGLVVVIALLACWLPAENAARMTIREALAYE